MRGFQIPRLKNLRISNPEEQKTIASRCLQDKAEDLRIMK